MIRHMSHHFLRKIKSVKMVTLDYSLLIWMWMVTDRFYINAGNNGVKLAANWIPAGTILTKPTTPLFLVMPL